MSELHLRHATKQMHLFHFQFTKSFTDDLYVIWLHTAEYMNAFCCGLSLPSRLSFICWTISPSNGPGHKDNISASQLQVTLSYKSTQSDFSTLSYAADLSQLMHPHIFADDTPSLRVLSPVSSRHTLAASIGSPPQLTKLPIGSGAYPWSKKNSVLLELLEHPSFSSHDRNDQCYSRILNEGNSPGQKFGVSVETEPQVRRMCLALACRLSCSVNYLY